MGSTKIIIAGGSGFLGKSLAKWYSSNVEDCEIVILSRSPRAIDSTRTVVWDGLNPGDWAKELEGASALINLAGRSVNCRYNKANRRAIMDSRIDSTRILGQAINQCKNPPKVWLNSSTATIYKHTYGQAHDEKRGTIEATPEAKDSFSIEVAKAWEDEFEKAQTPDTRKLILRTAVVFHTDHGSAYAIMRRLTRFGLGGKMGDGRQYVSWIHIDDFCRAIDWLLSSAEAEGIVNISSPNPITNAELMANFRKVCGRPIGLPAYRWMLEIGAIFLRTETELIIKSRRVVPGRLLSDGFTFNFPEIQQALADLENG